MAEKQKLYAYVDESGQETAGHVFVVGVVVLEGVYEEMTRQLEAIEARSHKGNIKWHKARYEFRQAYLEDVVQLAGLRQSIFFEIFTESKKYLELTAYATAKAILRKAHHDYEATVFVDGFRRHEVQLFTRGLRDLHIRTRKVRGVRREENHALIRLVDAICGLVRDANEGQEWAQAMLARLQRRGIAIALERS